MKKSYAFISMTILLSVLLITVVSAQARDFDFSGTFVNDNDVLIFDFTVGAPSMVTLFSSSWISGDPPFGFDPMLGVWTSSGDLIAFQDDGGITGSTFSNGLSYDHGEWDSFFEVMLNSGDYRASITQFDNFPVGSTLASGFTRDDNPDFTFDDGFGGATQPMFNGVWDESDPRTNNWEFHILNVEEAVVVPEPVSATLFIAGGAAFGARRYGRRKKIIIE